MNVSTWAPILSSVITGGLGAVAVWFTARHTRANGERTNDELRHQTDSTTVIAFNKQLLDERKELLDRVDQNVQKVRTQVTNGGTNLAVVVGEIKATVVGVQQDLTEHKEEVRERLQRLEQRGPAG